MRPFSVLALLSILAVTSGACASLFLSTGLGEDTVREVRRIVDERYCTMPRSERLIVRDTFNPTPDGNEVYVFCAVDPDDDI